MRIGILALQGAFIEHALCLRKLAVVPVLVRKTEELSIVDGLIIPGGESTAIGRLIELFGFSDKLRILAKEGFPIYGTCAGLILLAKALDGLPESDHGVHPLGVLDIMVRRNAFGRQLDSFEEYLTIPDVGEKPFRGIFIRAPQIIKVGDGVRVLAQLKEGRIVAVEQQNLMASAFHPELTGDVRLHNYFLRKC